LIDVFFKGHGEWWFKVDSTDGINQVSDYYQASGVFQLNETDAITYSHIKSLESFSVLLPSFHQDSEFTRMTRLGKLYKEALYRPDFEISRKVRPDKIHEELCYHPDSEILRKIRQRKLKGEDAGISYEDTAHSFFKIDKNMPCILTIAAPNKLDTSESKLLSESTRQTLLKLVYGMAVDAYGYDPDSNKNSATGGKNGISAKLQARGISITDDTIRKYLKEAKDSI
jgi:hypothetical protein